MLVTLSAKLNHISLIALVAYTTSNIKYISITAE